MRTLFVLTTSLATIVVQAGAQSVRIANDNYGFVLTVPAEWKAQRVRMTDPFPEINEFKAGRAQLKGTITIDTGDKEPADWNAIQFNGVQQVNDDGTLPLPQITVYANPRDARTFEQFTKDFTEWLVMFRSKPASSNKRTIKAGEAFDYTYRMGPMPIRVSMVYGNGVRYGFMMMSRDTASFQKHSVAFDRLVSSLELKKPKAPLPVQ
jgi:hypothetical protein